jgi:hypothetical protein
MIVLSLLGQADRKALPEVQRFMAEFRKTLRTDDTLLRQYSYTEKQTSVELDSAGRTRKTDVLVYECTPGPQGIQQRRLVSRNGVPVPREAEKENKAGKLGGQKDGKPGNEDEAIINDVFALYDFQIAGRETINGRPTIRVTFRPRSSYRPKTDQGEIMRHVGGQAWISEDDHQLAKIEAEALEPFSLGRGVSAAKVKKGALIRAERRKFNNDWLPVKAEFAVSANILLIKTVNVRQISEYSNYKKTATR